MPTRLVSMFSALNSQSSLGKSNTHACKDLANLENTQIRKRPVYCGSDWI